VLTARAPGKVNLSLFVGAPRDDGLHPLVSVVQPVSLADELTLEPAPGATGDQVRCPGVDGPNLAGRALALFRESTGWDAPPQRLTIRKRIPVAAGMGGGSADAAAALRLAAHAAGGAPAGLLHELAAALGADVPALLAGGRVLMTGAGEHVHRLLDPEPFGLVIVPSEAGLSTPDVYREFDRLGGARTNDELQVCEAEARAGEPPPPANDLQDAARALCPAVDPVMRAVAATGADVTLVSGSGPTVFGLFHDAEKSRVAAAALAERHPGAVAVEPAGSAFGEVQSA
jgi:4-diphosphocytidyl-2-C-methyl-D-erythritol kinase